MKGYSYACPRKVGFWTFLVSFLIFITCIFVAINVNSCLRGAAGAHYRSRFGLELFQGEIVRFLSIKEFLR